MQLTAFVVQAAHGYKVELRRLSVTSKGRKDSLIAVLPYRGALTLKSAEFVTDKLNHGDKFTK